MAQVRRKHVNRKHLIKLVRQEVSYFNGWAVSEDSVDRACDKAVTKILRYLRKKAT